jgi:hypothetical protein
MKINNGIVLVIVVLAVWPSQTKAQIARVDLGSAEDFTVLAGTSITVAGTSDTTMITGNIGTYPGTTITGLGNVVLAGLNHAGDAFAQTAQTDLLAAYNNAAGRSANTTYGAVFDLGGQTLTPGVYKDPSSFAITGNLTLNAQGNPNAVWIFQAGSTLTAADASHITLINGARADNIFWQVGSSATLNSGSSFEGNILASASITMISGATVDGRLLALGGTVTLDSNTVSSGGGGAVPEPAATSALIAGFLGLFIGVRRIRQHRRQDSRLIKNPDHRSTMRGV